jgi:hypothetical protein
MGKERLNYSMEARVEMPVVSLFPYPSASAADIVMTVSNTIAYIAGVKWRIAPTFTNVL